MRRDMLSQMGGEDEGDMRFGVRPTADADERVAKATEVEAKKEYEDVDWESMVSGTKKVLTMDVSLVITLSSSRQLIVVARDASDLPDLPTTS